MEKKENRSLAYHLAKVIDKDSLSLISGGNQASGGKFCHKETCQASGTNPHSLDIVADFVVDM